MPLSFVILTTHAINTCQIHQDEQSLLRNVCLAPASNQGLLLMLKRKQCHNIPFKDTDGEIIERNRSEFRDQTVLYNEAGTKKAQIVETHERTDTDRHAAGPERAKRSCYKRAVVRSRQQGPSISLLTNDTNTPESSKSFFPRRETRW